MILENQFLISIISLLIANTLSQSTTVPVSTTLPSFNYYQYPGYGDTGNNAPITFGADGIPSYYTPPARDQNNDDDIVSAITKKYNKLVRPIKKVVVRLRISLRQIVSVDEKNQIMTSNIYVVATWTDGRLKWNPTAKTNTSDFGNLTEIIMPATSLWMPDLFVINIAGTNGFIPITASNLALVTNTGKVYVIISVTNLQTRCKMNVYYFPFDKQNCSIVIGSWQHDTERLNFETTSSKIDIDSYQPNPVWTLRTIVVNSVFSEDRYLPASPLRTEDIAYYFTISRGSGYYMGNLIACFILNTVTLLAFFLPFAQQVGLCMTTFLTFSVQALNMANFLPVQSLYYPLVSLYFMFSIVGTFFSLLWFWTANNFITKAYLPMALEKVSKVMKLCLFCLYEKPKEVIKVQPASNTTLVVTNVNEKENEKENEKLEIRVAASTSVEKTKCSKCDLCTKCKEDKDKEDKKKKTKESIESSVSALNYLAWFIALFFFISIHIAIWLSCAFGN